jgi:G3E family GTPase
MQQTVKIDIVSGFLGAGKTTLINKLLDEAYKGERLALLENEFGEIGIDGDLVKGSGITVKELANGCICCTLQTDFIDGLQELVETWQPERILIEPTGLAQLADILAPCRKAAESLNLEINAVFTVVNAASYTALIAVSGAFFTSQIADARLIVLSATQSIPVEDMSLEEIVASLRALNPQAPIITEAWNAVDGLSLLAAAEEAATEQGRHDPRRPERHDEDGDGDHDRHHGHEHHDDDDHDAHHHDTDGFESVSFRLQSSWTEEKALKLESLLKSGCCGEVFRAKGLLRPSENAKARALKFDYVYGAATLSNIEYAGEGKLVVIGRELKTENLQDSVNALAGL